MSWRCPNCAQTLADEFDTCWRCGTTRSLTSAEMAELDKADAVEPEVTARPSTPADQLGWGSVAGGLLALREAHGHYRIRRERAGLPARPDLDRRWMQLYLAVAALLGIVIATAFFGLSMDEPWMLWSYLGAMVLVLVAGSRATRAELRADADAPRHTGEHAT